MTGATPSQLAFDKGHRVLGLRLVDASQSHLNEDKCAKHKFLKKISSLQLAPIIWILIFGLLAIFIDKVRRRAGDYGCCSGPLRVMLKMSAVTKFWVFPDSP